MDVPAWGSAGCLYRHRCLSLGMYADIGAIHHLWMSVREEWDVSADCHWWMFPRDVHVRGAAGRRRQLLLMDALARGAVGPLAPIFID